MKTALAGLLSVLVLAMSLWAQKPAVEGRADSTVRAVIYEDLQCPDCAAFERMLNEKLLPQYGGKVAFIHRDFPLAKHAWARRAAIAALSNAHYAELVEHDYQDGVSRGVVHTPTVFVNGRPFVETFTFEEISKGIDQALAEALAQTR